MYARISLALFAFLVPHALGSTESPWEGEWLTDFGLMELAGENGGIEGVYGSEKSLSGKSSGRKLNVDWKDGSARGNAEFEMDKNASQFTGTWSNQEGGSGNWRGWKLDPKAKSGKPSNFNGLWRSSLGAFDLKQKGDRVTGSYGSQGLASIDGKVTGRRLEFTWKRLQGSGKAWIELARDEKSFFGMTEESTFTKWIGQKLEGYEPKVSPEPAEIVQGISDNKMCYYMHAPKGWRKGKSVDAIVLLHGSNWVSKGMVWVASQNKDLAERFMIIGIDGQDWADWSKPDDPRQNYTYVNWMGKSTYQGYPNTDKESPFLVHQVIEELKKLHKLDRIFVGGHSQGGFLTSALGMHYPETFSGFAMISCSLLMQSDPDVFEDESLKRSQRSTPVAIVHGSHDNVVVYSSGEYTLKRFQESEFPSVRMFTGESGHPFDFLPFADAFLWMDALTTEDPDLLFDYAKTRIEEGGYRDVASLWTRIEALGLSKKSAAKGLLDSLDKAASQESSRFLELIEENKDSSWIDPFLEWKAEFEFAPSAKKTLVAFGKLRRKHDTEAERLIQEGRKAMNEGDRERGMTHYRRVVDEFYAATRYPIVKGWVN